MERTIAGAGGREVREEMSLAQRLGEGSQSSSGDFVFAVGMIPTHRAAVFEGQLGKTAAWAG